MQPSPELSVTSDKNRHIRDYLSYYFSLKHSPRYAVMVNGDWGIGKTFLIKKYLQEQFSEMDSYVYISLFGINQLDDIDSAIFCAMHPSLNSKTAKVAGKVGKAALKFFSVDLKVDMSDFLDKYKASIFIFDDLERCDIPINSVLGYINEFVEHDGCKVLVIANEKEIIPKSEKDDANGEVSEYERKREKLIGKTLEVEPSFEEAETYFISQIDNLLTREFFIKSSANVAAIFHQSELNNLRILQQTMWDFERIFSILSEEQQNNTEAMNDLLQMFFALSFELKSGRINGDDLLSRPTGLKAMLGLQGQSSLNLQHSEKRYPDIALDNLILSNELLHSVLLKGIINKLDIQTSINQSSYFISQQDEPAWRIVWHAIERTNEQFEHSYHEMEKQFATRELTNTGEMLHVFGLRLWLSDAGIINKPRDEIVSDAKKYIDDLYVKKCLETEDQFTVSHFGGYGGLQIHEYNTNEFRDIFSYLEDKRKKATIDEYPTKASKLMEEMVQDPHLYFRRLCPISNSGDTLYYRTPILASIEPKVFVQVLLEQPPSHQRIILMAFKPRYEVNHLERELPEEKPWLSDVRKLLAEIAPTKTLIEKHRLEKFVQWHIDPILFPKETA